MFHDSKSGEMRELLNDLSCLPWSIPEQIENLSASRVGEGLPYVIQVFLHESRPEVEVFERTLSKCEVVFPQRNRYDSEKRDLPGVRLALLGQLLHIVEKMIPAVNHTFSVILFDHAQDAMSQVQFNSPRNLCQPKLNMPSYGV